MLGWRIASHSVPIWGGKMKEQGQIRNLVQSESEQWGSEIKKDATKKPDTFPFGASWKWENVLDVKLFKKQ